MKNSLMFRLCYYRTHEVQMHPSVPMGYDTVRQTAVHPDKINLEYFEEAFTSSRWIVRIYKLKDEPNRGRPAKSKWTLEKSNLKPT